MACLCVGSHLTFRAQSLLFELWFTLACLHCLLSMPRHLALGSVSLSHPLSMIAATGHMKQASAQDIGHVEWASVCVTQYM